jgi:hypothetical protein
VLAHFFTAAKIGIKNSKAGMFRSVKGKENGAGEWVNFE